MNNVINKINTPVLQCEKLSQEYREGDYCVKVLNTINLSIAPGEQVAIIGRSGSGKTTLLQLLGGLDKPTQGEIFLKGQSLKRLKNAALEQFRNQYLGFIYQSHHLLAEFSALENVMMPLLIAQNQAYQAHASSKIEIQEQAILCLKAVGLEKRLNHRPAQLSGGERQRVAIARALVNQPACVLADEPTGNLDDETAIQVFEVMQALNRHHHSSLVVVTHDVELANRMDRVLTLHNGLLT